MACVAGQSTPHGSSALSSGGGSERQDGAPHPKARDRFPALTTLSFSSAVMSQGRGTSRLSGGVDSHPDRSYPKGVMGAELFKEQIMVGTEGRRNSTYRGDRLHRGKSVGLNKPLCCPRGAS